MAQVNNGRKATLYDLIREVDYQYPENHNKQ